MTRMGDVNSQLPTQMPEPHHQQTTDSDRLDERRYRKAEDVAREFHYADTDAFLRRWRQQGFDDFKSGRTVLLKQRDIDDFIALNTTHHPVTPGNDG